jgi:hypothetical protein
MKRFVLIALTLVAAHSAEPPRLPKPLVRKPAKRLVAPTTHGATMLLFPAVVPPVWKEYSFVFRYAETDSYKILQCSKDLSNWFPLSFTYTNGAMYVTNPPGHWFRMKKY